MLSPSKTRNGKIITAEDCWTILDKSDLLDWEEITDGLFAMRDALSKGFHRFTIVEHGRFVLNFGVICEDEEFEVKKNVSQGLTLEYYNDGSKGTKRICVETADPMCYFTYTYETYDEIPSLRTLCKRTIVSHDVQDEALPRLLRDYVRRADEPTVVLISNRCPDRLMLYNGMMKHDIRYLVRRRCHILKSWNSRYMWSSNTNPNLYHRVICF